MGKIKLSLITKASIYGGLAHQVYLLAHGLKKNNYDVTVIFPSSPKLSFFSELLKRHGIKQHRLIIKNKFDIIGFIKTVQYLKVNCFNLLHVHLPNIYSPTLIYLAGKLAGIKNIITTPHSLYPLKKSMRLLTFMKMKYLSFFNSKIIGICTANRTILVEHLYLPPKKVVEIKNGIDLNQYFLQKKSFSNDLKKEFNLNDNAKVVGTIGTLTSLKGVDYFIKACDRVNSRIRNVVFFVIGDGPEMAALKKLSAELKIEDNTIFTGLRIDSRILLSQFDIFVLASLTESLPTVILEALALRIPVIATDVGGVAEIIDNNKTGILVPTCSTNKLSQAIITLLSNQNLAKRFAETGYNLVKKEFNLNRMIEQTTTLYEELIIDQK